jgi:hypothetical protein
MQFGFTRTGTARSARTRNVVLLLLTPALMLILNGCAAQKPFQFHANSITRISYNPKNCTELPNGKFRCKDVIFHVAAVEPTQVEPTQEAKK